MTERFDSEKFRREMARSVARLNEAGSRMREAIEKAMQAINKSLGEHGPTYRETLQRQRYEIRIEQERAKGLTYVRNKAAQVRRELGLPEN